MTTTVTAPLAQLDEAVTALNTLLSTSDDVFAALEALEPFLHPYVFATVAPQWEMCPVHVCDVQICVDDQDPTCPAGQGR